MNHKPLDLFKNPLKFNLKNIIVLILLLIGLYLLLPKLVGLEQAIFLLSRINKFYLVLAIVAKIISFIGATWLLGIIFLRLGDKINFWIRFRLSSISAFTMHFLPIGAAGSAAFEYSYLHKRKVDPGSILLMWILRLVFNYSGFIIIFLISLVLVPTYPSLSFSPKIISPIILILILSTIFYTVFLYKHREKFLLTWKKLFTLINKVLIRFKQRPIPQEKQIEIFEDIYQGIGLFGQKKRSSIYAILSAIIYWLGDIACLYFVFLSFGFSIGLGILIFGYCVATLLGNLSFIPGGMGVTEGTMVLIFSSLGVEPTVALTAVLVFRLFSFWMWIPIGLYSFLALQKETILKG